MKSLAVRNGLWNAVANVIGVISGMASSILIVRSMSPDEYGSFSYYIWLAGLMGTLGTLAFPNAVTKISSELHGQDQRRDAAILSRFVHFMLFFINLTLSVIILLWANNIQDSQKIYFYILAGVILPNSIVFVARSTLWGEQKYKAVSIITFVALVLQFALVCFVYAANLGLPGFVFSILSSNIFQAIGFIAVSLVNRSKHFSRAFEIVPSRAIMRRYFSFALPYTLVLIFETVIWQRSELFFLEKFSSKEQIGFYSLAYTLYGMCLALGWSLINGFYPAISYDYGAKAWSGIREKIRQAALIVTLFAVPLTLGAWVTLQPVIAFVYGEKMLSVVPVAQVLFAGLIAGVIAAVLGLMINAVGDLRVNIMMGVVLSFINIGLDILLIPRLHAIGGAIANTLTQVVYATMLFVIVYRKYKVNLPWFDMTKIALVGVFTTFILPFVIRVWVDTLPGLIIAVSSAAILYTAIIWRWMYVKKGTMRSIMS
jgi:O-antigen/teichoic acid export membrane protein